MLAIRGDAGVGKTRIMSEYARQNGKKYDSDNVFWFNAISADSVREDIRKFVVKYQNISEEIKDTKIIFQAFKKWIEENENYLFLLDNVESYNDIKVFLDNSFSTLIGTRHILITSRLDKNKLPNIPILPIKEFEREESRSFLQSHTDADKYNEEYAEKIADLLGNLPLALEQAAAIIQSDENETYKKFYEELEKEPFEKLETMHPEHGAVPVAATWNMAMQRISSDAAKELLWLCAYFAPDNINDQWFVNASEVLPENLKNDIQTKINEIEDQLKKYSLLTINNGKISIHRLLQEVVRKTFKEKEQKILIDICINILDKLRYSDFSTNESRTRFSPLVSHFLAVTNEISDEDATEKIASLYYFLGYGYCELADYKLALEYYKKDSSILEKILGKEHPDTATTYNNMALVYDIQGNYDRALEYHGKALVIREKVLDKEHPDTATTYHNMAQVYYHKENYELTLKFYKKDLAISKKVLGKEHPNTATTYNNMALVYDSRGDYDLALKYHRKALAIYKKVLEKEHLFKAVTYVGIGLVYYHKGEHDTAFKYYEKALPIYEKVLGKEHLDTAATYNNMALVYDSKGDYDLALKYFGKALEIAEKVWGKEHPNTKRTYNNMYAAYEKSIKPQPFGKWLEEKFPELFREFSNDN